MKFPESPVVLTESFERPVMCGGNVKEVSLLAPKNICWPIVVRDVARNKSIS
jgi:hypothetical protein